jgi:hypothetical protein
MANDDPKEEITDAAEAPKGGNENHFGADLFADTTIVTGLNAALSMDMISGKHADKAKEQLAYLEFLEKLFRRANATRDRFKEAAIKSKTTGERMPPDEFRLMLETTAQIMEAHIDEMKRLGDEFGINSLEAHNEERNSPTDLDCYLPGEVAHLLEEQILLLKMELKDLLDQIREAGD